MNSLKKYIDMINNYKKFTYDELKDFLNYKDETIIISQKEDGRVLKEAIINYEDTKFAIDYFEKINNEDDIVLEFIDNTPYEVIEIIKFTKEFVIKEYDDYFEEQQLSLLSEQSVNIQRALSKMKEYLKSIKSNTDKIGLENFDDDLKTINKIIKTLNNRFGSRYVNYMIDEN